MWNGSANLAAQHHVAIALERALDVDRLGRNTDPASMPGAACDGGGSGARAGVGAALKSAANDERGDSVSSEAGATAGGWGGALAVGTGSALRGGAGGSGLDGGASGRAPSFLLNQPIWTSSRADGGRAPSAMERATGFEPATSSLGS